MTAQTPPQMEERPQVRIDARLPEAPLPHTRSFFLFPGYDTVPDYRTAVPPLRPQQKWELASKTTFDYSLPVRAAITTAFDEATGLGPDYGNGAGGAAKLFGYNAANLASNYFFADALLPIAFHQDPRFFRKGRGSVKSRIAWAAGALVVTYSDRGRPVPNYSQLLGYGMSSALSNAYEPRDDVTFGNTMESFAIKEGVQFGLNLMHEFHVGKLIKQKLGGA